MSNYLIYFLVFVITISSAFCERPTSEQLDSVVNEAIDIYLLERASWISTDVLISKVDLKSVPEFRGYISYQSGNDYISTYWVQKDDDNMIFQTYRFPDTVQKDNYILNDSLRPPNEIESLLYQIRDMAFTEVFSDSMFTIPENARFNYDFLINESQIRVFLLTSSRTNGVIPFGNDYVITFDRVGNLISKEKIHRNLIPIDLNENKKETKYCIHGHKEPTSPFITSTDICNIMLYGRKLDGGYIVISKEWVSLYNLNNPTQIYIVDKETFINPDKE